MIYFCQAHLTELERRWARFGGREEIIRNYGEVVIDPAHCEYWDCLKKRIIACPHCGKSIQVNVELRKLE